MARGVRLHCLEWRRTGRSRPFVLVHGLASNARTWEAVAGHLAQWDHPVTAVDLRGHGRSDKPDDGYDFGRLCDDLVRLVGATGYERPVVVGQSMGGNLALELARAVGGSRLAGVAGVDGGVIELQRRWPDWEGCAAALAPPTWDGTPAVELEARLRRTFPSWDDWGIEATMANLEIRDDGTVQPRLSAGRHLRLLRSLWEHRPSAVLGEVGVPLLLVVADRGADTSPPGRSEAERAAAAVERGRVHWVSPADHDVHVQHPGIVAGYLHRAAVDGFFALSGSPT